MKILSNINTPNFLLIYLIILTYKFQISLEINPYIIYESTNIFPRPLLLDNSDVMAFSGDPAMMSRYNSHAEVIYSGKYINKTNNFKYAENACIRQFSYDPNNATKVRFVLASGRNTQLTIYLFTEDDGIISSSTFDDTYVISYKIDIFILNDNSILGSFVNKKNSDMIVHVRKLTYDENIKQFNQDYDIQKSTTNLYISCTQVSNGKIVCQYVHNTCEEKGFNFDENGNNIKDFDIEITTDHEIIKCGFDKVIFLRNDYVVFTYMNDYLVKFKICEILSDGSVNCVKDNINNVQLNDICRVDTNQIDVAKFNDNTFVISCTGESDHIAYIDYETFSSDRVLTSELIKSSKATVNHPFVSQFSGEFLSIFYNLNGDNVFEIIKYPICKDYESQTIYINANTAIFTLKNNIAIGTGQSSSVNLELYFPEKVPKGTLFLKNDDGTTIEIGADVTVSKDSNFFYQSSYSIGDISIKYAGKSGEKPGAYCSITFHVTDCYEGCHTCKNVGTKENMLCYGCNKTGGYYTDEEYKEKEEQRTDTINCYNELTHENYYLDGDVFKRCWTTCKFCNGTGDSNNHLCKECKDGYLPVINNNYVEGDTFNCVDENSVLDGYYSNGTHFLQCYISCKTCSSHGDETHNNCTSCNVANGYYSFEDENVNTSLKGQCSKTDYPGYHYLYTPEEGSTDEPMWKVCYTTTCATCIKGGSSTENNCETCITNYYKIEDDTKGTCTNESPEHHYLNTETITTEDDDGNVITKEIKIYKECYEACHNCTAAKNVYSMNCATNDVCYNSNYHKLEDNDTECHNDSTVPDNYYYNETIQKYKRCNIACKKCSGASDNADNTLCLSKKCSNGYAYLYNITTQCYIDTTKKNYYYLSTDENGNEYYAACADGCLTCTGNERNDCTSCDNEKNYYQKYTNKGDETFYCYYHPSNDETDPIKIANDEANSHYIVTETETVENEDGTTSVITKYYVDPCYSTCKTCIENGTTTDHNCITCIDEYYFIYQTDNCAKDPDEYYLDEEDTELVYKHCYTSCKKCTELGGDEHNKCNECKSGYISYIDETYPSFKNCKIACPAPKYYNKDNICDDCVQDYEYIKYNLFCINCKDTNQYHKLGEESCIDEDDIPNDYYKTNDEYGTIKECDAACKTCIKCTEDCEAREVNCTSCADSTPIMYNNYCYSSCPDDNKKYLLNGECVHECPYYLYTNDTSRKCEECPSGTYKNKNANECTETIPNGNVQIDVILMNVLKQFLMVMFK